MGTLHHHTECSHAVFGLNGERTAVQAARDHTREFLGELDPPVSPTATTDILMLISELVTNAVRHAPGSCTLYLVYVTAHGDQGPELTVAVSDTSTVPPSARTPDMLAGTGGLGWHMIENLTKDINIHILPLRGKTIETTLVAFAP